jgi:hypothetical protein
MTSDVTFSTFDVQTADRRVVSLPPGQLAVINEPELSSASLEVWARGPNNRLFSANHSETVSSVSSVHHATPLSFAHAAAHRSRPC